MSFYDRTTTFKEKNSFIGIEPIFSKLISQSKSFSRFYAYFHVLFISFLSIQLLSFLLFFSYFTKSMACASALALFFLTLFSYFVLLFFFQGKKTEQLLLIRNTFLNSSKTLFSHNSYLPIAKTVLKGVSLLSRQEHEFYKQESLLSALTPLMGKCKIRLHQKNFLLVKESLFSLALEQVTEEIKQNPLDLEAHALLVETYLQYGKLYLPPEPRSLPWISAEYFSFEFRQKFLSCSQRALEECLILEEYGEKNIWLYRQISNLYELRGEQEKEILAREELKFLSPEDPDALFRLGSLYFKLGYNAKGLKIYEELSRSFPKEAERLIGYYPFSPFDEPSETSH